MLRCSTTITDSGWCFFFLIVCVLDSGVVVVIVIFSVHHKYLWCESVFSMDFLPQCATFDALPAQSIPIESHKVFSHSSFRLLNHDPFGKCAKELKIKQYTENTDYEIENHMHTWDLIAWCCRFRFRFLCRCLCYVHVAVDDDDVPLLSLHLIWLMAFFFRFDSFGSFSVHDSDSQFTSFLFLFRLLLFGTFFFCILSLDIHIFEIQTFFMFHVYSCCLFGETLNTMFTILNAAIMRLHMRNFFSLVTFVAHFFCVLHFWWLNGLFIGEWNETLFSPDDTNAFSELQTVNNRP